MTGATSILLDEAERSLRHAVSSAVGQDGVIDLFAMWAMGDATHDQVERAVQLVQPARTYRHVAATGFAHEITGKDQPALVDHLLWLAGRPLLIDGTPTGVTVDAVALLGVLLGCHWITDGDNAAEIRAWVPHVLEAFARVRGVEPWRRCLVQAASVRLGHAHDIASTDASDTDGVRLVLAARGVLQREYRHRDQERDAEALLRALLRGDGAPIPVELAAVRLGALGTVRSSCVPVAPGRLSDEDVIKLLRGVPGALARWTWEDKPRTGAGTAVKWEVANEYHVQSLLMVLLRPIFPDLKDEESVPSTGHAHPRVDFVIPSMRLAIEVKFLRRGTQEELRRITEEVAADAALYRSPGSPCDRMIVFVWDDSMKTEEHATLEAGLRAMGGVVGAVIVARPGLMKR